jgi:hypothetical protein
MVKKILACLVASAALYGGVAHGTGVVPSENDHLVPVEPSSSRYGSNATYRKLWQEKLLITSGEIARYVHLPALKGIETTMSIYRVRSKRGETRDAYEVTATQPSEWLWQSLQPGQKRRTGSHAIRVTKLTAPLPESTALAIHGVWLAMLQRTKSSSANEIEIDSDTLIFSAADSNGVILRGRASTLEGNIGALADIAGSLVQYCDAAALQRPARARQIENAAHDLLKRVSQHE